MNPTFREISVFNSRRLPLSGNQQWDEEGVLHLRNFIPARLIDDYIKERTQLIGGTDLWRPGWPDPTPYMRVPTMRRLACLPELMDQIRPLIGGDEPGLHLCLTGFQSTERAWHQDRYLNPEAVGENYIAAWITLDDVQPDVGPFEYVPGSHRWPVVERERVWSKMRHLGQNPDLSTWPSDSQDWLGQACAEEIVRREGTPRAFLGKKGDVLLWHASLLHRGSRPTNATAERKSLIAHYSGLRVRPDMPNRAKTESGTYYFVF